MFEEHWDPKSEELDPLKVVREVPQIFVVLSKQALPDLGVEAQQELRQFLDFDNKSGNTNKPPKKRGNRQAAERLGVTNPKKPQGSHFNTVKPKNGPRPNTKAESKDNRPKTTPGNTSARASKSEKAQSKDLGNGKENQPEGSSW